MKNKHETHPKNETSPERRNRKPRTPVTEELIEEIVRLYKMEFSIRKIAKNMGLGRKVVRRILVAKGLIENTPQPSLPKGASKLDPFQKQIEEKMDKNLTTTRILREIKENGYTGGKTILAEYINKNSVAPPPKKRVWRRFETAPGEETQFDWSPYRVELGGKERVVYAFGATLGYSRKIHVYFYMSDNETTLLEAHTRAFADFEGITSKGVYDRMATVVLGTIGKDRKPLWHPRFKEFVDYYGYTPFLCKPRDPDRKGKDERVFLYLERDFLKGSTFDSLEDLNNKVRIWLDNTANCRNHGTTKRVPDEAWQEERPFFIALPDSPYPACNEELRQVGPDSVISVKGTHYTVPAKLAHLNVTVRLFAEHFEVLDSKRQLAFSRRYVDESDKGKLIIDSNHYESVKPRTSIPGGSVAKLEDTFCTRFPTLERLVLGIKKRMKGLAHIHLRTLWRLADRYGDDVFLPVAERVQSFNRYDAIAVKRILERDFPITDEHLPMNTPLTAAARVMASLSDVDSGSLDDYAHIDKSNKDEDDGEK